MLKSSAGQLRAFSFPWPHFVWFLAGGLVWFVDLISAGRASADRPTCTNCNSYLRRIGLVRWEHWYSSENKWMWCHYRNSKYRGLLLMCSCMGDIFPTLFSVKVRKNPDVPFKKNVLDWVNAAEELMGHRFPVVQRERDLHYDIKVTKWAFFHGEHKKNVILQGRSMCKAMAGVSRETECVSPITSSDLQF